MLKINNRKPSLVAFISLLRFNFNLVELDLFEENIRKFLSLNPNPAKYANLMKKLQRNKKFGQSYLDAITSFDIEKVD